MYCKFCGKQIDEDSAFCSHCGKQIKISRDDRSPASADTDPFFPDPVFPKATLLDPEEEDVKEHKDERKTEPVIENDDEDESSPWGCLLFLIPLFAIVIAIIIAIASQSKADSDGIFTRDLRNSDYYYSSSQDLTSYSITLTPYEDIERCEIELFLYNSNGQLIYSDTITKYDLKEDSHYTYTFNFGFTNSLSGRQVKYYITGTVSGLD